MDSENDKSYIEIVNHKAMEKSNQLIFGGWNKEHQIAFVHEYRKLEHLSYALADGEDSPFDLILDVIESHFPAYKWSQIHDENDDINENYQQLLGLSRSEDISDEEFLESIMEKN